MSSKSSVDFVRSIVVEDVKSDKYGGRVITRFPPEPNGHLHIGHAASAWLNFGVAAENGGICNLRFDDTNPTTEDVDYVDSIKRDLHWLGLDWGDNLHFASDYFGKLYELAIQLINANKAYVCDLSTTEIRDYRGTLTTPGKDSPSRNRSIQENLELFKRMRSGEYDEGTRVLRAKIDMASGNLNMRDPVIYRILKATHHRTGNKWCIYPTYDFAHGQSDSIENVTHSICTMEFEDHRPLYEWFQETLGIARAQQIEFARVNLTHTVMSKRKLLQLVTEDHVTGWNDPRMPTLSGMRRRGYTPESIKDFCERVSVARRANTVEFALLEHCVRDDLNKKAKRVMGVLDPLRVVIENYPEDLVEEMDAINNPEDSKMGTRKIPFTRELFIEREDFKEEPTKKFFRLAPGREVRLRYGYFITCTDVVKDDQSGEIVELRCTYDPETRKGQAPDGRKVRGTIHWVSATHSISVEVRLYDHLFLSDRPGNEEGESDDQLGLNPKSLTTLTKCRVEPSLANPEPQTHYQFERKGYFYVDSVDSKTKAPVFNLTVSLRDSWSRAQRSINNMSSKQ